MVNSEKSQSQLDGGDPVRVVEISLEDFMVMIIEQPNKIYSLVALGE